MANALDDPPTFDDELPIEREQFIPYNEFVKYHPTPDNLKIFQRYLPPIPDNPALGFALELAPLGEPAQPLIGGWLGASICLGGTYASNSSEVFFLDVLRIASLCGKPDIVETLLAHRAHSIDREIESLELLGAVRMFCSDSLEWFCNEPWTTQLCWTKALELKALEFYPIDEQQQQQQQPTRWSSHLMRLRDVQIVTTRHELDALRDSTHELFVQAFLHLERVLGLPWRVTEPMDGVDFITTRLLGQMLRGVIEKASSTAHALELVGYLIAYAPDRLTHTWLLTAIDKLLDRSVTSPNRLLLMQNCRDLTIRDAVYFLKFYFGRHPSRKGYESTLCVQLVCSKLEAAMFSERTMAENSVTKDDLNLVFHCLAIVWAVVQPKANESLEALATRLLELGAAVSDPCWFRMKCSFELVTGRLERIVQRFHCT